MLKERESCVLCAVKHIAQARVLLLEMNNGYPQHYFFALGHLAEAEDELSKHHPSLRIYLRQLRKSLELNRDFSYPFSEAVLRVAVQGEHEVTKRVQAIEAEFEGKTLEELRQSWTQIQK